MALHSSDEQITASHRSWHLYRPSWLGVVHRGSGKLGYLFIPLIYCEGCAKTFYLPMMHSTRPLTFCSPIPYTIYIPPPGGMGVITDEDKGDQHGFR